MLGLSILCRVALQPRSVSSGPSEIMYPYTSGKVQGGEPSVTSCQIHLQTNNYLIEDFQYPKSSSSLSSSLHHHHYHTYSLASHEDCVAFGSGWQFPSVSLFLVIPVWFSWSSLGSRNPRAIATEIITINVPSNTRLYKFEVMVNGRWHRSSHSLGSFHFKVIAYDPCC